MKKQNNTPMIRLRIFYIAFFIAIFSALTYVGCSDPVSDLTTNPLPGVHPDGWTNTTSSAFHGKYIFDNKAWNLKACAQCHGADYLGGTTGSSCYTCHTSEQGPEECTLCHGGAGGINPPKALNGETSTSYIGVGMHYSHLDSTKYSAKVQCVECHVELSSFDDPAHIGDAPDGIADVHFGELARKSIGGGINPDPVWNRDEAKCSNTYCHGNFVNGNPTAAANWTQSSTVYCGTCHGDPTTQNPNPKPNGNYVSPHFSYWTTNDCYLCHNQVMNTAGQIIDKNKHVNGEVNFNR
jgi:predicted CxxxxCH...CXXCH cytochrome family protein